MSDFNTVDEVEHGTNDDNSSYDLSRADACFRRMIREQALQCMDHFFFDKKYWAGGKIPKSKLFNESNILVVMQTSVIDAFDVAYAVLEHHKPQSYKHLGKKGWEIIMCYEALKQCGKRHIPKCFAGGLMLVYLSLCQGVDCFEKLKEYNAAFHGKYDFAL